MSYLLEVEGIKRSFSGLQVLKGVDLTFQAREIVSIVGPSGAGKTTLLNILSTLDTADYGKVFYEGRDVHALKKAEKAHYRNRNIGIVFQFHNLLPEFTALENVCIPGFIAGREKNEVENKALELLHKLGIRKRAHHKPSELSGGEQQRTSVARALINDPKVIFADEPSGNLDSANADELHRLFFDLREEMGHTFIIVTHNRELAKMTDRTITLTDGLILSDKVNSQTITE